MPHTNLDKIFKPKNIALIGASDKGGSAGSILMRNLTDRSKGELFPVNQELDEVYENETFSDVEEISESIDLGIITPQNNSIIDSVEKCGSADIPALLIISDLGKPHCKEDGLEEKITRMRKKHEMRILGPNSLGIMNPHQNLNASLIKQMPEPGELTFLSQSDALSSATLDWAMNAQFGFSSFVSVGDMIDVNFADLIDYFGRNPRTGSILMYVKEIMEAERFMSAARGFARTKPIMAVKSGKHEKGARNLPPDRFEISSDKFYDAAFKRAGITRVDTIEDLFTASETLAKQNLPEGSSLAIVTNAEGPEEMATDALIEQGGSLADLSEETKSDLGNILPEDSTVENPINFTNNISPEKYKNAVKICLEDENVNGILCLYTPLGTLGSVEAAEAIASLKEGSEKPILPCWMGGEKIKEGQQILRSSGYSVQSTPEQSITAYMYLNSYARNLERLLETPEELPVNRTPPKYNLKVMLRRLANEDREYLSKSESRKILETYGIPIPQSHLVTTSSEAAEHASEMGFPVNLKVQSHDIRNEDLGIARNLNSREEIREAYDKIIEETEEKCPSADIDGVIVEEMISDIEMELILGLRKNPVFKSGILFGRGGKDLGYYEDIAIGYPPLNQTLAHRLIEDTKVYNRLRESGEDSTDVLRSLEEHLIKLSQLIIDFPEIDLIDINPFVKTGEGFLTLDVQMRIDSSRCIEESQSHDHLVIEPYPRKYVEEWELDDGRPVTLRPIRPEDEPLEFELFETFSEETWRNRFFGPMKEVSHEDMVRYTNIDYRREMAIIGILEEEGKRKMIGVGRLIIDPGENSGEFAIVVGDPWQGLGLGEKLTDAVIGAAEDKGLNHIWGTIMKRNKPMINLCEKLGFEIEEESEDTVKAILHLRPE